ncbi:hypothetical protein AB1K84_04470 [Mesobacillus foraminis]|uniref:hypothetical protein n=1 Tax=Mesobacillus foraminis TaxID=279826 RepID=UPI0039A295FE
MLVVPGQSAPLFFVQLGLLALRVISHSPSEVKERLPAGRVLCLSGLAQDVLTSTFATGRGGS